VVVVVGAWPWNIPSRALSGKMVEINPLAQRKLGRLVCYFLGVVIARPRIIRFHILLIKVYNSLPEILAARAKAMRIPPLLEGSMA